MDDLDDRGPLLLELAALGQELDSRLGDHDLSLEIERTLRRRGATPHRSWLDSRRRRVAAVLVVGIACVVAVPPARAGDHPHLSDRRDHRGTIGDGRAHHLCARCCISAVRQPGSLCWSRG